MNDPGSAGLSHLAGGRGSRQWDDVSRDRRRVVAPTGQRVEIPYVMIMGVEDNKAARPSG